MRYSAADAMVRDEFRRQPRSYAFVVSDSGVGRPMLPSGRRFTEYRLSVRGADRPWAYEKYSCSVPVSDQLKPRFGRTSSNFTVWLYGAMYSAAPIGFAWKITLPFASVAVGEREVHRVLDENVEDELPVCPF